jgi:flagellar hook protein FlgE
MSFYTALSGLNAAQRDIAATSNNIANVGTVGFHRSRAEFADIFANSPYNRPTSQVGDGVETARMTRDFSQGTTRATGNVLDLSLRGPGFFQVRTGGEGSDFAYTRAGAFQLNNAGQVVNAAGAMLMGFPVAEDGSAISTTKTGPISIPQSRGEAKATSNISLAVSLPLGNNGGMGSQAAIPAPEFSATDPASYAFTNDVPAFDGEGRAVDARVYFVMSNAPSVDDGVISATYGGEVSQTVGRVAVANFADVQALTPVGNSTYLSTTESGEPRIAAPGEAGYGQLRSGVLEQSNVELTEELVHLITAQRNYQASAKALETSSSLAQTIIQMRG